ncbi:MAG: NAD(+)/NADH kinase [Coriobacteriia bacterium]|jgi:NAD+ kinase|nr:NAD(+)/NADH kinase [Coriobacteriia bacterium]MDR2714539.1 NAD(+)/NADH kinase [Coriobacteriales bacterium]
MKVLLVANSPNEAALEALLEAKLWLEERGLETETASSDDLVLGSVVYDDLVARIHSFELVCAFGGDGTLLRAARVVAGTKVPLLGFNYGNVGFLAGATSGVLAEALTAVLAGEVVLEQRVMLEATITYEDGSQATCSALNEVFVGRSNLGCNIIIDLSINNDHLFELRGDGAIVATATGSTAYALAAGGPLLTPGHRGLCVVPLSPHPFATPSIVTAPNDVTELVICPQSDQTAIAYVDGQQFNSGESAIASLAVKRADEGLTLVRYNTPDFYARLAALFDGAHHA